MASFSWPSTTGGSSSNASIGPNGSTAPTSSTLVAGENPTGNLQPLQTDASGNLFVSLSGSGVEPIPVSQSGVWNITNITGTVSLPTGASTSSLQTTANTSLSTIVTNTTGIATAANQTTGNNSLSTIATNTTNLVLTETVPGTPAGFAFTVQGNTSGIAIPVSISGSTGTPNFNLAQYGGASTTLGIKAAAASMPVVIASDQVVPISATSLPLPTGAATSSNQTTAQTSLTSILANQTNGTQLTQVEPRNGTLTDNSGTTSGTPSTSTTVMAINSSRRYLLIENVSTTATVWINFTSAATAANGSYELLPGGSLVQEAGFVSTELVTILSTTASVPYTAKQA